MCVHELYLYHTSIPFHVFASFIISLLECTIISHKYIFWCLLVSSLTVFECIVNDKLPLFTSVMLMLSLVKMHCFCVLQTKITTDGCHSPADSHLHRGHRPRTTSRPTDPSVHSLDHHRHCDRTHQTQLSLLSHTTAWHIYHWFTFLTNSIFLLLSISV